MPYEVYKLLHIIGIVLLFMSMGGLAVHGMNGGDRESNGARKVIAISHGVALLLIIVAGFGLLARMGDMSAGIPTWVYPKLLIWLLLGGGLALLQKKPELAKPAWFILPLLAAAAGYLAIYKPGA